MTSPMEEKALKLRFRRVAIGYLSHRTPVGRIFNNFNAYGIGGKDRL